MEDLFQILIFLILIISFFSSIFKKKKPEETEGQQHSRGAENRTGYPKEDYSYRQEKSEVEEYDNILNEIENLFKEEKPVIIPTETQKPSSDALKAKTKIEEQSKTMKDYQKEKYDEKQWSEKTTAEHIPTASEHSFEDSWQRRKEKVKEAKKSIDKKTSSDAERFEQYLKKRETKKTTISDIKRNLDKPQTIQEYIIFSEILGKPKALRRR